MMLNMLQHNSEKSLLVSYRAPYHQQYSGYISSLGSSLSMSLWHIVNNTLDNNYHLLISPPILIKEHVTSPSSKHHESHSLEQKTSGLTWESLLSEQCRQSLAVYAVDTYHGFLVCQPLTSEYIIVVKATTKFLNVTSQHPTRKCGRITLYW